MTEQKTIEQPTETALTLKHAMLSTVFKKTEATKFIELIDEEVMKEVCDVTTPKGREREKSLSGGISSFKAHMNRLAEASIEKHVLIVKTTRSYLKEFNANCDERRDKRKAPSLKHEADQQERKDGHRAVIKEMKDSVEFASLAGVQVLIGVIESILEIDVLALQEYTAEGELVKAETLKTLNTLMLAAKQKLADDAEVKRLQGEAEKRKVDDAKALADKEAADAAEANKEQERLDEIAADKIETQRQIDEEERIFQAKIDATKATEVRLNKIQDAKAATARFFTEKAENNRIVARNKELERQADKQHRALILGEVFDAIRKTKDHAELLDLMEHGQIPHVIIVF